MLSSFGFRHPNPVDPLHPQRSNFKLRESPTSMACWYVQLGYLFFACVLGILPWWRLYAFVFFGEDHFGDLSTRSLSDIMIKHHEC